ncbi:hypothetical protein [uncultured Modestobacter sp.]|uniref:DUF7282 domain-containing protein n=1 Tax=uncultured Modestobacter sp. TaxID=380048 RepID=UPI00262BA19D|nr:hypothetical protein [uncultured Modestobacter sp.]
MTRHHRALLAVPTAAVVVLLSACGSGDGAPVADDDGVSPSSPATAGQTTALPGGRAGSGQQADIEFEDQSGDGSTALVGTVSAPEGGFVVLTADGADDAVLGWADVQVGTSSDVEVSLDPPLAADTALVATLYADTDRDGSFDPGADEVVPAPIDGGDADDDVSQLSDPVEDDAQYTVG